MKEKISGIYCFEAVAGNPSKIGWKYVGYSIDCTERQMQHWRELNKGRHNPKLQRYYNRYGKSSLKFHIIYLCPEAELEFWEKWFVKAFDSYKHGFNCSEGGEKNFVRYKPGTLINFKTRELVDFDSIRGFADQHGLNRCQLSDVLAGKVNRIQDWCLPRNIQQMPKKHQIINAAGNTAIFYNSRQFCCEQRIGNISKFNQMLNKKLPSWKGWKLYQETVC